MKKIAVFGKPGSGKSTLSKKMSLATGIPLHQLDSIVYKANGTLVDRTTYDKQHGEIVSSERWIIDGLGPITSFYQRLAVADTLVYIDIPYTVSYWLVTKRLLKSLVVKPEGWPDGSSVVKGTIASYKMLRRSSTFWNEDFLQKVAQITTKQSLYVIKSMDELNSFITQYVK